MRILFLHRAFPGQFRYLATGLARDPRNEVVFLTTAPAGQIPGVKKVVYQVGRAANPSTHGYLQGMESAVLYGQAAYRAAKELKKNGFVPDLIVGHSGWGPTLFMADIYPQTPILCYFEWFYQAQGSSFGFDPKFPVSADNAAEIRVKNAPLLMDLANCHAGITPTWWQHSRFPAEFRDKLTVLHDGIDTEFFQPGATADLSLQTLGLDLASLPEIVTYVATGMEPLRGFPQFMEAVSLLQRRRPQLHAVIVGEDRTEYEKPLPGGKTYRQAMLERFPFDLSRLHFTGRLSLEDYRRVLLASSVHIYLTYPFILSWSLLEAMSCGCLVVGSDTSPVRELIRDRVNGHLVDFFSPQVIAETVETALTDKTQSAQLRQAARQTIIDSYDVRLLLPQQLALLQATVAQMGDTSPRRLLIQSLLGETKVCARTRILEPNQFLATIPGVQTQSEVDTAHLRGNVPGEDKVFIWQRIHVGKISEQQELLRRGYLIVAEMDDDPLRWPEHSQSDFFTFRSCHAVQVSTEALAEFIRPLNPNVAVFPNQLAYLPSPRVYGDGVVTLFFGALNREMDWLPVMPCLNRLLQQCPKQVKVTVIHDRAFYDALETVNKEFTPFCSYEEYVSMLRQADVALLPLLPTRFNRMKSDLKFLECAGNGVVALASPTVYEASITDGETGFIYRTPEEFETKLKLLIEDSSLRRKLAGAAYSWVGQHRLLSRHYQQRYTWYRDLLARLPELNAALEERVPGIVSGIQ